MKKAKLFFSVLSLFVAVSMSAQKLTVSGVVIDSSTSEPVSGATVVLKGDLSVFTTSGIDGSYKISAPSNGTLQVSCLGYISQEVNVNGRSSINVNLNVDSQMLEETVVVGYGSSKKVGNTVGIVTTVKSDIIKNAPSQTALDALQGQVAGMQVMSTGGVAGDNSISMKIHGVASLSSTAEPLFIVDGVQSSSTMVMQMNPNDVQNVTVLKDASSTSIYGALGANGVVYITTKSGGYNEKATITVTSQAGISTLSNLQFYKDMMSGDELKDFWIRSGIMTPDQIYTTYTSKGYNANTEWFRYFQNVVTPQYQNDVTVEGGSKTVAYLISASQFHQDGTAVGNYFDRYTLRSNVQARPVKWLKLGANITGYITTSQENPNWGSSSGGASYGSGGTSYLINPLYPAVDENGEESAEVYSNGYINPRYYMSKRQVIYKKVGVNGAAFLEINPIEGLTISSRLGTDSSIGNQSGSLYPSASWTSSTWRAIYDIYTQKHTLTNTIEYANTVKEHSFSVLLGHEGIRYNYNYNYSYSSGFSDDRLMEIENGKQSSYDISEYSTDYSFLSFFTHADYNYAGRYFVDGTFRYDASSRFGANNRWAPFWALGGMWKISKEEFMKSADWVDDLDLKVSYGTQGNASIGNYTHLGLVGVSSTKYDDATYTYLKNPANESLTWEKQKLLTVSLSAGLWDCLNVDVDFYNRRTSSMLLDVPQPYTTGFSEVTANVGTLQNTGVDITLGVDVLKGADYGLNIHGTFNYNAQKITELFDGRTRWEIANTGVAYVVGKPIMYYAPIWAGVDPEDGAPMWYLPGDDKDVCTMDPSRTTKEYDEDTLTQNTGMTRYEPISGGFGLNAHWKGLGLNVDFSYFGGKYLINNDAYFYANPAYFTGENANKMVSDFWTPEHRNAKFPDWSKGYQMQFDTHLYENASFLRLKNVVLAYTFPTSWFKNQSVVKGLRISVTGRNLWTATKYTGLDPEVDSNLTYGIPGNTRQVLGGIEITF